jgi:transposase
VWTDEQILTMLDLHANEGLSEREIAARFGVTKNVIVGLRGRVRGDDRKVPDLCQRPENRDGGQGRNWWRRRAPTPAPLPAAWLRTTKGQA